jgi:hypothetical protein
LGPGNSPFLSPIRRFAVVEKRWRVSWEAEGAGKGAEMPLPEDYEVAAAFANRRRRYGFCFLGLGVAGFGKKLCSWQN